MLSPPMIAAPRSKVPLEWVRLSSGFKHFFELVGCQKNCKNWALGKNGAMLAKNGAILGKNGAFQPLKIYTRLEKSGKTSNQGDPNPAETFQDDVFPFMWVNWFHHSRLAKEFYCTMHPKLCWASFKANLANVGAILLELPTADYPWRRICNP